MPAEKSPTIGIEQLITWVRPGRTQVIALVILLPLLWLGWQFFWPVNRKADTIVKFTIERGESSRAVAEQLAQSGVVRSSFWFLFYSRITFRTENFQAGRYAIGQNQSIANLTKQFADGRAESSDISVFIPEGSNLADIDKILAQVGLIRLGTLLTPENLKLEGHFFPDTYYFWPGFDDNGLEIKNKLLATFAEKVAPLQTWYALSETEFREKLIVASLLEKEVRHLEEMRLVAGIMYNRLKKGMPLQIDATVGYGVCLPKFEKGIYCDVSQANIIKGISDNGPYSTYKRKGFPPGPITNPGLQAIVAAMNPLKTDYYYYLSARDGRTIFSKTGAEHEANRRKYLGH
ncbi:MAG: hypothetical protein A3F25_02645 [Candidatus Yanofskybacteria bacterium RIFCSPHIGHO2_12_FULL_45_19b]|uniref:Endolytic murein transglycosylase n=1 Tax=Candidatus Yanofskybacteria bacterium RIFCSPHIGHO2_12_FULL_45_19b TaxID=1802689 RepID=A0A1F8G0W7_9BACT|nr:MAG: hypothetical protein A3F25_02645 [Candidatus Yanofskybacteria bacterium RIFCSPHIGHO2_12_FULL_45_19b]